MVRHAAGGDGLRDPRGRVGHSAGQGGGAGGGGAGAAAGCRGLEEPAGADRRGRGLAGRPGREGPEARPPTHLGAGRTAPPSRTGPGAGGGSMTDKPFDRYSETFFEELHRELDFEQIARGYGEYYYDCLPDDRDAPVLDVGCGTGQFLRFLETKGYRQAEGLDLSPQQAAEARKHVTCPVHVGEPAEFLAERPGYYAAISLNDVLEHVPKDQTIPLLATLRSGLRPDGVLVVNVPGVVGFTSAYVRYNDFTHQ